MSEPAFVVADEVATALAAGRPVVALETTVVTHGLPAPHGLRVAAAIEAAVREAAAVPATIGILGGQLVVGLTADQLATLAELTATKIYEFYLYCDRPDTVIFHGGGVFNKTLMKTIANKLGKFETSENILPAKYMEAAAFAYLAYKNLGVIFK